LLALALANMTGIPFIHRKTMCEWRKTFGLKDSANLKGKDVWSIASASFLECVKIENCFDRFISDGASFTELMLMKANLAKQRPTAIQHRLKEITGNLEYASFSYAAGQYDCCIHVCPDNSAAANDVLLELLMKYHVPYKMYHAGNTEKTLMEIVNDLHLPAKYTAESAIYQAKVNLFIKP
jgi:hypothetical protein